MSSDGPAALLQACASQGLSEVLFVRHANAAPLAGTSPARLDKPHDWKREDQMRVLTDKGREQCLTAQTWFSTVPMRCLISSPARRASETAMGMAASAETLGLRMVEGVHPAGMSETCENLFDSLGYGPLRKFFAAEGGEAGFRDYGRRVTEELSLAIASIGEGAGTCAAVFGHAVFLNAIALELAQAAGCTAETADSLLDMDLGETQGILVDLATGSVTKKAVAGAGGASLVAACRAQGVTQLVMVRHANAAPLAEDAPVRTDKPHHWKKDDQKRVLTDKGKEQCMAASTWFSTMPLRAMFSSPARRASETAVGMAAQYESEESKAASLSLLMVESVHPAGMSEICESLFETMGYGPLRKFYEADGGEAAFRDYGNRVCEDLGGQVTLLPESSGTCVAVFGHAVFLNAIALEACLAANWNADTTNQLLDLDLGETQGIKIDVQTGSVEKMQA